MKLVIVVHSEREYQLAAGANVRVWLIPDNGSQELRQNKSRGVVTNAAQRFTLRETYD